MTTTEVLDTLRLPTGVHATVLSARDIVDGTDLVHFIVWHDRPFGSCPRCDQPIQREPACPVNLNPGAGQGGALEDWDQMHGCGEWLSVRWDEAASIDDIENVAATLKSEYQAELAELRDEVRRALAEQLKDVLDELAQPLVDGESEEERRDRLSVRETEPGVTVDENGVALAWDEDPGGDGDSIFVAPEDIPAILGSDSGIEAKFTAKVTPAKWDGGQR